MGVGYYCESCPPFCLCFKCYLSKNIIHPDHNFSDTGESNEYDSDSKSGVSSPSMGVNSGADPDNSDQCLSEGGRDGNENDEAFDEAEGSGNESGDAE